MDNPIRLHWLDPRNPQQEFPPPDRALRDPNGLLAIGGDLSADRLLRAYRAGVFPWFNPDEPILWWSPDPRAVLFPRDFHTSRSLRRRLARREYAVSIDRAFAAVLLQCAAPRRRSRGTWLGHDMQHAYLDLYRRGHAHSIEIWNAGRLAGGVYGVALGRAFFGESMFSACEDGSKIALHHLCKLLDRWGYTLMDCQIASPHLATLGAVQVPRNEFLLRLRQALADPLPAAAWQVDDAVDGRHLPP